MNPSDAEVSGRSTTFRAYVVRLSDSPPFWYVGGDPGATPRYRPVESLRSAYLFGDPGPAKRVMTAVFSDREFAAVVPVDVTIAPVDLVERPK